MKLLLAVIALIAAMLAIGIFGSAEQTRANSEKVTVASYEEVDPELMMQGISVVERAVLILANVPYTGAEEDYIPMSDDFYGPMTDLAFGLVQQQRLLMGDNLPTCLLTETEQKQFIRSWNTETDQEAYRKISGEYWSEVVKMTPQEAAAAITYRREPFTEILGQFDFLDNAMRFGLAFERACAEGHGGQL